MSNTLETCKKYFGSCDIYKLLNLTKNATDEDVRKAYHRMSLQIHPDRVIESEKEEATEKFKLLKEIIVVLTNPSKKAIYDEQGIICDEGETECHWPEFFNQIIIKENENFHKCYSGSDTEKSDIRKAYLDGKGCLNFMLKSVPFMTVEKEPRIIEIVKGWIAKGEVPEYKQFTEESKAKRNRRHKLYSTAENELFKRRDADSFDVLPVKKKIAAANKASKGPKRTLNKVRSGRVTKLKKK